MNEYKKKAKRDAFAKNILKASESIELEPCRRESKVCEDYKRCADGKLACRAFHLYLLGKEIKDPEPKTWGNGRYSKAEKTGLYEPTKQWYEELSKRGI